jgi:predicted DNA-binding transcriptional regulator AlpA
MAKAKFHRHHLDRRAGQLLAATLPEDDDDLLTTKQVADWLGMSDQWLEVGRGKGYGPPYVRLSARGIRYKRNDVVNWLKRRSRFAPS